MPGFINPRKEIPIIQPETLQESVEHPKLERAETESSTVESLPETKSEEIIPIPKDSTPELRTRIKKATEAIYYDPENSVLPKI